MKIGSRVNEAETLVGNHGLGSNERRNILVEYVHHNRYDFDFLLN